MYVRSINDGNRRKSCVQDQICNKHTSCPCYHRRLYCTSSSPSDSIVRYIKVLMCRTSPQKQIPHLQASKLPKVKCVMLEENSHKSSSAHCYRETWRDHHHFINVVISTHMLSSTTIRPFHVENATLLLQFIDVPLPEQLL